MKTMVFHPHTFKTLLANTLREKSNSYTVEAILEHYPNLHDLLEASVEELMQIKGVGPAKAKQIKSTLALAHLLAKPRPQERYIIRSPQDAYEYLRHDLQYQQKEHFIVTGLNTKNHVLFKETVSIGTLNASLVHPREVFRPLIRRNCASAIVGHNHPSGDPTPSKEDISITKRLMEAGEIIGIDILDHLIIGDNTFLSLKEKGHM